MQVDVVVGAGSGMGAAVARALAGTGPLVLADRDGDRLGATAAASMRPVECITCDVTRADQCEALAARVPELGVLVVTAGLSPTMGTGEEIYAVNLVGLAALLDALEPTLVRGSVAVCFASIAGHGPPPPAEVGAVLDDPLAPDLAGRLRAVGVDASDPGSAYGLSKHGVIRMVRHRAGTWAARGARIVSLSPGIVDTPMGRRELGEQPAMQPMIDLVGRMGTAEEVATVAAFLASDAAAFVHGCDVLVDGGFTALAGLDD